MQDRTSLHELIDSLPEEAVEAALRALRHFQKWPPEEPARLRELREEQRARMRQAMRPGMVGAGGGGGSYTSGPGGRIENGSSGFSFMEDGASVAITHRFFAGHEVVVEERLRLSDDGMVLVHTDTVRGPDGTTVGPRELAFRVTPRT
jgi:hypothetical protein